MNIIELKNIEKYFGNTCVIPSLNLEIKEGEFLTLLGPSGCGKTTLLRMIAGFEVPTTGSILLENKDIASLQPYERDVNTVFQNYALFPHMSVFENIAFGLKRKGLKNLELENRVNEVLELVQMRVFAQRKPKELSGGQQQRIALARAIVNRPKVLLLDEPLAALDLKLRKQMQVELKQLHRKLGITFIFVTHDQEEALTMSDRIAVMNKGKIEQLAEPEELYNHPKTKFVSEFIGENNAIEGKVEKGVFSNELVSIKTSHEDISKAILFIRPEHIVINREKPSDGFSIPVKISGKTFLGNIWKIHCKTVSGLELDVSVKPDQVNYINENQEVFINWDNNKSSIIEK